MEPDSSIDFVVEDLPGIGRSYQMTESNGGRITVVIHHSGRRVVHGLNVGADQASAVELSDHPSRAVRDHARRRPPHRRQPAPGPRLVS